MKKIVFVCPNDKNIEIIKVTSKVNISREKICPICNTKMNFIHRNKKKYKLIYKKGKN